MGSDSDLPVVQKAIDKLRAFGIPVEAHVMSAHRTPEKAAAFAAAAADNGFGVIIAAAGKAAHLAGVIAGHTTLPVIGIPIKSSNSIDGWDSILSILQMPAGIPVATMALDGARNGAILAVQILAAGDEELMRKFIAFKSELAQKIGKANRELAQIKRPFKTN